MQENKKKKFKPKQDTKNQLAKGRDSTIEVGFATFFLPFCKKCVLEPELEDTY